MDFLRVRADQKLQMHIPLHFMGEDKTPGVKDGGVISHLMSDVEVSCLPADLPEFIEVDISNLALNDTVHLSNLTLPKGVELTAFAHGVEGHDLPVVSVHIPQVIEEETPVAAEGEVPTVGAEAGTAGTGSESEQSKDENG